MKIYSFSHLFFHTFIDGKRNHMCFWCEMKPFGKGRRYGNPSFHHIEPGFETQINPTIIETHTNMTSAPFFHSGMSSLTNKQHLLLSSIPERLPSQINDICSFLPFQNVFPQTTPSSSSQGVAQPSSPIHLPHTVLLNQVWPL